jgi:hypothetical protein
MSTADLTLQDGRAALGLRELGELAFFKMVCD